jgi:hypothetical protein
MVTQLRWAYGSPVERKTIIERIMMQLHTWYDRYGVDKDVVVIDMESIVQRLGL